MEQLETQSKEWVEELKADKEFGGDNFDANSRLAFAVMLKFSNKSFMDKLSESKLGNHPELVKLFHRIGNAIGPDKFDIQPSSEGVKREKFAHEVFYPEKPKE